MSRFISAVGLCCVLIFSFGFVSVASAQLPAENVVYSPTGEHCDGTIKINVTPSGSLTFRVNWNEAGLYIQSDIPNFPQKTFFPNPFTQGVIVAVCTNQLTPNQWLITMALNYGQCIRITVRYDQTQTPAFTYSGFTQSLNDKITLGASDTITKIYGDPHILLTQKIIYRKADLNSAWQPDVTGLSGSKNFDIAITSTKQIFALTSAGLFTKITPTSNWTSVANAPKSHSFQTVYINKSDKIFIADDSMNTASSTDFGVTWVQGPTPSPYWIIGKPQMTSDAFGSIYIQHLTKLPDLISIYKLSLISSAWVDISSPLRGFLTYPSVINQLSADSTLVAATSFGLAQSTDQGLTWSKIHNDIPAQHFSGFVKTINEKKLASTTFGITRQNDSLRYWERVFFPTVYLPNQILIQPVTNGVLTLTNGYINKTQDDAKSWKLLDTAGYYVVTTLTTGARNLYIEELRGQHVMSDYLVFDKKQAKGWKIDTLGLPNDGVANPLQMISDGDSNVFLSFRNSTRTMYSRSNETALWQLDTLGLGTKVLDQLTVDRNHHIIGSSGNTIYRRLETGWQKINIPSEVASQTTHSAVLAVDSNNVWYAGFAGKGVYYTRDSGSTWTPTILHSSRFDPVQAPLVVNSLHSYRDTIYATTDLYGIFIIPAATQAGVLPSVEFIQFDSIDFASTRDSIISVKNIGTDTLRITNITSTDSAFTAVNLGTKPIAPAETTLVKITYKPKHSGLAIGTLKIISNAKLGFDSIIVLGTSGHDADVHKQIADPKILQCYPNPATDAIHFSINFALGTKTRVELINDLGQTVRVFENVQQGINYTINLSNIATGNYFLKVTGDAVATTEKIVVAR